jgi:hypothetical protein
MFYVANELKIKKDASARNAFAREAAFEASSVLPLAALKNLVKMRTDHETHSYFFHRLCFLGAIGTR